MKVVILAGGLGTRLGEETNVEPKPMLLIGDRPILWHIMKIYSHYGFNDFIICCGYKGYRIKEYFHNYLLHQSDVTIDIQSGSRKYHESRTEPWRVTLVDTGQHTMTGGRLLRIQKYLRDDDAFFMTYGDGVGDINIAALLEFHKSHGRSATLTSVTPPGRFGAIMTGEHDEVLDFVEKPTGDGGRINGGFFVLSSDVFKLLTNDNCIWEHEPLQALARDRQLKAYKHSGFWRPMDTMRDKLELNRLWNSGEAGWKVW